MCGGSAGAVVEAATAARATAARMAATALRIGKKLESFHKNLSIDVWVGGCCVKSCYSSAAKLKLGELGVSITKG